MANRFDLRPLQNLLNQDIMIGIISIENNSKIDFAILQGEEVRTIGNFNLLKETKKKQSLNREQTKQIFKEINNLCQIYFSKENSNLYIGFILAGNTDLKKQLISENALPEKILNKIINVVDTNDSNNNSIQFAIQKSQNEIKSYISQYDQDIMSQFQKQLAIESGLAVYGRKNTLLLLEQQQIKTLIVSKGINDIRLEFEPLEENQQNLVEICANQDEVQIIIEKLKDNYLLIENISFLDWILTNYSDFGCEIQLISADTEAGKQFLNGFQGISGILRYQLKSEQIFGQYNEDEQEQN